MRWNEKEKGTKRCLARIRTLDPGYYNCLSHINVNNFCVFNDYNECYLCDFKYTRTPVYLNALVLFNG